MTDLQGSILVTGAGSGFGQATALAAAKGGLSVIAGVENDNQVSEAETYFGNAGVDVTVIRLNLLDTADIAAAGEMDVRTLINNAGFGAQGPILETGLDLARKVFDINVFGTLSLTQAVAHNLIRRGKRGKIVYISSVAGLLVSGGAGAYTASKHALEAIAEESRAELAPSGIEVHVINPGPFATGFNERLVANAPQVRLTDSDQHDRGRAELVTGQFDPAVAVDAILRVATTANAPYRTVVPSSFIREIRTYQEQMWE